MTEPEPMERTSQKITEEQKAKLRQLFPEVFSEGKVDFDRLKLTLGDDVDDGVERYGMSWPGKRDCFKVIQQPSAGTLKPCKAESVNFDDTENLFIEGDNLEVLKLLQKSYYGKVKMIYIDPPYNTGKEFIYPDNWKENLDTYLEYTGQTDESGKKFSTNTESEGRFHSKWLNMMYPRLFLARNLLRDDGVIFVSIGEDEIRNLRYLCDEIFGEENFVGQVTWKARVKPVNIGEAKYRPQKEVEYVLVYQKALIEGVFQPLYTGGVRSYPHTLDGRKYRIATILKSNRGANHRTTMSFEIDGYAPPEGQRWQAGEDVVKQLFTDGYIEFREGTPFRRYFEDEEGSEHDPFYCFMDTEWSSTSEAGKNQLNELIGNDHGFDTVKPSRLIRTLIQSCTKSDSRDVVLDFFAGSCTTAQAVWEQNNADGGNRRFVLVQLPEPAGEKSSFENVTEIGKERIRRVIQKLAEETQPRMNANERESKQANLFANSEISENSRPFAVQKPGFKVFKLDRSNFKAWRAEATDGLTAEAIAKQLELGVDHIDPKSTPDDILYELLIKSGFELTAEVETLKLADKTVYSIASGALLICLEPALTKEVITAMAKMSPARVLCLDRGFAGNDQLKTNAVQIMKSHEVEDFRTV